MGTTLTQGTAAPVTLSVVSGLPPGAVASFATNPVTPTGSSDLTISTLPGVLGDYTLTLEAQFGVLVQTITVNLHIYDFTVGIGPSDLTVLRGTSALYDLSLTLVPGSSTIGIPGISMAVSGSPPDAAFTLSATTITPTTVGCTISTLPDCQYVTVATAGPPGGSLGDFTFHVTGTDPDPSGGSRSGAANLHIYDFAVGVSPSDQTIIRGQSAAYSLSLTLVPGSTSTGIPSVVLGVSGLPLDATSSFSVSSITPTFAACTVCPTLTVTTAGPPGGSLGDFTFHATGTDPDPSGGSRSGSANLHLFDYTVTLSPPASTLSQGTSTTMTVSVGLVPGSSIVALPPVSLTLTGLPSGVTETGFPSSLNVGSSQAFTVQTSTVGSYVSCPQVSNKGGQNLKGADLQSCNLSGYNLSGDNLVNANLQGADLQNANLAGANLMNANLASAYTSGTDFQGANMKGVDISSSASVSLGTFTLTATGEADGVLRSGTSMLTVYGDLLSADNFQGTNLLGANLVGDLAVGTQFQNSNLMGDSLQGGDFMSSNFQGANMMGTNLSNGNFSYALFQGSNLMDSNMSFSNFNFANFTGSNTNGTNITGATFIGAINPP